MKGVLVAIDGETQAAVKYAEVGIAAEADAEVETAVARVAVVPVAVVDEAVARGGMEHRLRGLVNGIVVKLG